MASYEKIKESLSKNEPVLLDGSIGAEIYHRGTPRSPFSPFPWSLEGLVYNPQSVIKLHSDYILSGANIITANAFRTNRRALGDYIINMIEASSIHNDGLAVLQTEFQNRLARHWAVLARPLTMWAIFLARLARARTGQDHDVVVAGNMTTLGDCYDPYYFKREFKRKEELRIAKKEHREKARHIKMSGADLILLETINSVEEARVAVEAALETGLPTWLSVLYKFPCKSRKNRMTRIDSESALQAIVDLTLTMEVNGNKCEALLFNCAHPDETEDALVKIRPQLSKHSGKIPIGVYCNVEKHVGDKVYIRDDDLAINVYPKRVQRWIKEFDVKIVGGCCGTSPPDIAELGRILRGRTPEDLS